MFESWDFRGIGAVLCKKMQKALSGIKQQEGGAFFGCLAFFDAVAETFSCCEGSFQNPVVSSKVYEARVDWAAFLVDTCQVWVTAGAAGTEFNVKIKVLKGEITQPQSLESTTLKTACHPRTIK